MEIDTNFLQRLDAARDQLIEIRRDMRIINENIDQVELLATERHDLSSLFSEVLRRLGTNITSLNGSISRIIKYESVRAGRRPNPIAPLPPGPFKLTSKSLVRDEQVLRRINRRTHP